MTQGANIKQKYIITITTGTLSTYIERERRTEREREAERDIDLQELIDLASWMLVITTTEILQGTEENLFIISLLIKQCFLHPLPLMLSSK